VLEVVLIAEGESRRVPWRNGGGVTLELARWPLTGGNDDDFEWRLSRAPLERAAGFSHFPGIERVLTVIAGAGLLLSHGDAAPRARLRRLEPYRFSGAWPTTGEPIGGPVEDLNVMVREGGSRADVQVLALGRRVAREPLTAGHALAHLVSGTCVARVTGEEEPFELEAGDTLWLRGLAGGEELELAGLEAPCEVVLVGITRR
jgi:environmental stress-induced protein Ves